MKRRKWIVNALRFVFSAAFLFLAYKLIRFDDTFVVKSGDRTFEVKEVREEGDSYVITVNGSAQTFPKSDVERREGFITLFNKIDRRLYFALAPCFIISLFVISLRWWILLRGHGFEAGPGTVYLVTYIGAFFNNFLPGAVGGDIARAMIAARGEERKAALVGTVLLDRVVGLAAMIVMATACVLPFAREPKLFKPVVIVFSLFGAMILSYFVYFSPWVRKWIHGMKGGRVVAIVREIDGAIKMARERKKLMLVSAVISLLAQVVTIVLIYGLSRALGIQGIHLYQFFIFEPIIFIVTAVPLSLGGWGVQEGAYALLFGLAGVAPNEAIALSILYKLTLIVISLPGGILFAFGVGKKREGRTDPQVA